APKSWIGKSFENSNSRDRVLGLNQSVFEMRGSDGVERLHAVSTIADAGSPALFVNVEVPLRVCYERANHNLARNLVFLLAVAVGIVFAGRYCGNRFLLRPVHELARAAGQLAAGNLAARVGPITGSSELMQLGRAFDDMAE